MSDLKEEKDPNGVSPNQPGAKLDHGKLRAGLVIKGFQNALKAVAEVGTFGANKYTDDGWKSVPDGLKRYEDALYRHLLADGLDEQSGLPHLAHAAWNILAMLELLHGKREDEKVLIAAVKKWSGGKKFNSTEIVDRELFNKSRFYVDGVDLTERGDDVVDIAVGSLELGPRDFEGLLKEKGLKVSPIVQSEDGYTERMRRNNDRIRDIVAGTHFTDEQLKQLEASPPKTFSVPPELYNWQFSREMWEYAYCNPKNRDKFITAQKLWSSWINPTGVSFVLTDKDVFNGSDLVVDGIHVPSLPKELVHSAIIRMYPYASSEAKVLAATGIAFITFEENK